MADSHGISRNLDASYTPTRDVLGASANEQISTTLAAAENSSVNPWIDDTKSARLLATDSTV